MHIDESALAGGPKGRNGLLLIVQHQPGVPGERALLARFARRNGSVGSSAPVAVDPEQVHRGVRRVPNFQVGFAASIPRSPYLLEYFYAPRGRLGRILIASGHLVA